MRPSVVDLAGRVVEYLPQADLLTALEIRRRMRELRTLAREEGIELPMPAHVDRQAGDARLCRRPADRRLWPGAGRRPGRLRRRRKPGPCTTGASCRGGEVAHDTGRDVRERAAPSRCWRLACGWSGLEGRIPTILGRRLQARQEYMLALAGVILLAVLAAAAAAQEMAR